MANMMSNMSAPAGLSYAAPKQGNMLSDPDTDKISAILNEHKDKNFVQRILSPDTNPVLDGYNGKGTYGTHLMAYASAGDKFIVYPEIVQEKSGNLRRLGRREAIDYAIKHKEYIPFDTEEEAAWFGTSYKKVWGGSYSP